MTRLIHAELRKIFTTKLWWGLLAGALLFAAVSVVGQIAGHNSSGSSVGSLPFSAARVQQSIFSSLTAGQIFILLLGIIGMTTEFRHFTSRPTFLFEPRRDRVIGAKLVAYAMVGILYAAACAAVTTAIAWPWLATKHVAIAWSSNNIGLVILGGAAGIVIFAVVGIGVGVMVRNQIAATIGALAFLLLLENLIGVIPYVKSAYRYLPGAAASALTNIGHFNASLLQPWAGGLVLLGWGLAFAAAGTVFTVRRDVP